MRTLESVARETLTVINERGYVSPGGARVDLGAAIDTAVAGTTLLREADLVRLVSAKAPATVGAKQARLQCRDERGGRCAQRALDDGARRVGVLNYANGIKPGGGFLHGARAQEEALCRMSGLYACLGNDRDDVRAFYTENRAAGTALVTGHILTSPDVPFFRNEELDLLPSPYPVTVITAAAPDLGWLLANTMDNSESKDRFDDVAGVFARRTQFVFAAAAQAGCDVVVVGPWGCGAFGNDAEVVAEAFVAAVSRYRDAFDEIVFSTWGPAQNREAFEKRFADNGLWR